MKLNNILIIVGVMVSIFGSSIDAYTIRRSNKTSNVTFNPGDIHVHTTLAWCPDSRNEGILEPLSGYDEDHYGSRQCGGACFDWFKIKGHKFYIPNHCHDVNIEVNDDGVLLNGSTARSYGDIVAFFKDAGIALGGAFGDVGSLIEKTTASTLIWVKNAGEFIGKEAQVGGNIIKAGFTNDEDLLNKSLKEGKDAGIKFGLQTAKSFEKLVKNTVKAFSDMGNNPERPDYCAFSTTSKHSNMPKTLDDPEVRKQDKEELIDVIKKYAPISYLDKNELYYPIWADEYFTSPTARIKSKETGKEYLKGNITFEKIYKMGTCMVTDDSRKDLYFENDTCVTYGSNPAKNKDAHGNLTVPIYVQSSEYQGKYYVTYWYFYGLNGPYDIGPFKGIVGDDKIDDFRNLHESDLEHFTIELDKNTKNLLRLYYGSHSGGEGFWFDAKTPDGKLNPEITWEEGTHPVVYIAHGGHGNYPKEGTYVRIFGMASDVNVKGQRWAPAKLMRVYKDDDSRFDPKTMGWLYWPGSMGAHGVDAPMHKDWFVLGPKSDDPEAGDRGRKPGSDPLFCSNPSGDFDLGYEDCINDKAPKAGIPD